MKKNPIFFFSLFLLLSLFPVSAIAGVLHPDLLSSIQTLSSHDKVPVIISMADTTRIHAIQNEKKSVRRAAIIKELKNKAGMSQKSLRRFLREKGSTRD